MLERSRYPKKPATAVVTIAAMRLLILPNVSEIHPNRSDPNSILSMYSEL